MADSYNVLLSSASPPSAISLAPNRTGNLFQQNPWKIFSFIWLKEIQNILKQKITKESFELPNRLYCPMRSTYQQYYTALALWMPVLPEYQDAHLSSTMGVCHLFSQFLLSWMHNRVINDGTFNRASAFCW